MVPLLSILAQCLVDPEFLDSGVENNEEFVGDDGLPKEGPGG
jgi:hypothetical protein